MIKQKIYFVCIISTIVLGCYSQEPVESEFDTKRETEEENEKEDIETLTSYIDPLPPIPAETPETTNITEIVNKTEEVPSDPVATHKNLTNHRIANCIPKLGNSEVQIVNDTELIKLLLPDSNITSRKTPGICLCVLFYSKYCPFSSHAAPHYNALPRAFPDIKMIAINAIMYHIFNTQNGIVGVPSLLLLHNGKIIDKFNESDYTLEQFSRFITKNTGILPEEKSFVTSADFSGPVSSVPNKDTDILLAISWTFILSCAVIYFMKSKWWRWIVESVKHNWRESEAQAQHEHVD